MGSTSSANEFVEGDPPVFRVHVREFSGILFLPFSEKNNRNRAHACMGERFECMVLTCLPEHFHTG